MKRAKAPLIPFAVIAALIGFQAFFVAAYVGHEHEIYAWDHIMYFNMARQDFRFFGADFADGWYAFCNSFTGNYNHIFALPSFASFYLFGISRRVFLLTNFFVFFVAYEAGFAFLLRRVLGFSWRPALIFSLAAALLVPPLWLSLLEGYPDIGAAACILFAFAHAFSSLDQRRNWRSALVTGAFLAGAILLRRHFVYPALALLVTTGLFAAEKILRALSWRARWIEFGRGMLFFTLCGAVILAALELIAPDFLQSALSIDYTQLYVAYKRPPLFMLRFIASIFGIGLLAVATSGLVLLGRKKGPLRRLAVFVSLFVLIWLVIWCRGPAEAAHHYMLHALPVAVLIGFVGWFLYLAQKPTLKKASLGGVLLLCLIANSARALWFSSVTMWPHDDYPVSLFSAPRPPIKRPDYDEWLRLAAYLQKTTTPKDHIEVIGASIAFSLGVLYGVYEDILNTPEIYPRLMEVPEIDHVGTPPLNVFATSDVYVVATPTQYHLDPAGQKVVTAAALQFPPPPSRAALFRLDPEIFHMVDGITVRIWRRKGDWPPEKLHEALAEIRRAAQADRRFDLDWITVAMPLRTEAATDGNRTAANTLFSPGQSLLGMFFDYPLAPGSYRLSLRIAANYFCPQPQFRLTPMTGDGRILPAPDFAPTQGADETSRFFSLPQGKADYFLRLDIKPGVPATCKLSLRDLRVEKIP
jgi:hypothetical protein